MSPEPQLPTAAEGFLIVASLILFALVWAVIAQRGRTAGQHAVLRHLAGLFGGSAAWFLAMLVGLGAGLPGTVATMSMIASLLMLQKLTSIAAYVGNIRAEWLRFKAETKDAWRKAEAQTAEEARARREAEESRLREQREERERQRLIARDAMAARLQAERNERAELAQAAREAARASDEAKLKIPGKALRTKPKKASTPTPLEGSDLAWIVADGGKALFKRIGTTVATCATAGPRKSMNELIGMCRGVLADGVINADEMTTLLGWLERHRDLEQVGDVRALMDRIGDALADGVIDADEEGDLLNALMALAPVETASAQKRPGTDSWLAQPATASLRAEVAALPYDDPAPSIRFDGSLFVVTGVFKTGGRAKVIALIAERGGVVQKTVTKATHYLVVGALGSAHWTNGSSGLKIERAVAQRMAGQSTAIVSEAHWAEQL